MGLSARLCFLGLFLVLGLSVAEEVPRQPTPLIALAPIQQSQYYWQLSPVGSTAQLLTLFCRSCEGSPEQSNVPLVAVLRDTLGDDLPENDRVSSVWLLTYSSPNLGRRMLSGVPFFFWSAGQGSSRVNRRDTKPLLDLTQPQHPVLSEVGRDLVQWTAFDPLTAYVRSTSRAYRANGQDDERLHLEEAVNYLRQAPTSDDSSALTRVQLDIVIARLELRKRLLGGLVTETSAAHVGEELGYEQERVRSRNWELLRQCAEKTGLIFEPIDLAGTSGEYAMMWFPLNRRPIPTGTATGPVWRLLNIHNPWTDKRLEAWKGPVYTRAIDLEGGLLPAGETGDQTIRLVPLGLYSLTYPKLPLLLVDFRDNLHLRWHEMTQRSINEITAGVIGVSHFTNWYYYLGADLYDFVTARHGGAMDQAARLDSYSQFRVSIALDQQLNPTLRQEIQSHVNSLAINPLGAATSREMQAARARYALLQNDLLQNDRPQVHAPARGVIAARLDKQRREELAEFGESNTAQVTHELMHVASFGAYNHRVKPDAENLSTLDQERRLNNNLEFLDSLVAAGTQPEIAYDSSRIRSSVTEVGQLVPNVKSPAVRLHAQTVLARIRTLSRDGTIQSDCSQAIAYLRTPTKRPMELGVATVPRSLSIPSAGLEARK